MAPMAGGPDGGQLFSHCKIGVFAKKSSYDCGLGNRGRLAWCGSGVWRRWWPGSGWLSAHGQSMPRPLGHGRSSRCLFPSPGRCGAGPGTGARASSSRGQRRSGGGARPHPERIGRRWALAPASTAGMSCVSEARWHQVNCATVTNIIADVMPGAGKPVLLMAHSDSVAAGPGAGDDGSGVAVLLETIRALKARAPQAGRPVTALFSDGEEPGLLGAICLYPRSQGQYRRGGECGCPRRQRAELSVPDQFRRCRADRALCQGGLALCDLFDLPARSTNTCPMTPI